jgi:hypothetical protein
MNKKSVCERSHCRTNSAENSERENAGAKGKHLRDEKLTVYVLFMSKISYRGMFTFFENNEGIWMKYGILSPHLDTQNNNFTFCFICVLNLVAQNEVGT